MYKRPFCSWLLLPFYYAHGHVGYQFCQLVIFMPDLSIFYIVPYHIAVHITYSSVILHVAFCHVVELSICQIRYIYITLPAYIYIVEIYIVLYTYIVLHTFASFTYLHIVPLHLHFAFYFLVLVTVLFTVLFTVLYILVTSFTSQFTSFTSFASFIFVDASTEQTNLLRFLQD